ncbi:MAG: class I SAM-dependent methyltransferase [Chloroflexi bacterium]|nr:class I SAM-dependent methyltransferase [Chloroflexota bacterium]
MSTDVGGDLLARWDRMLEVYAPRRERWFEAILCLLEQRVASGHARRRPRVLDLGCGTGTFGVRLLDRLPDARYQGVDADPVMCQLAGITGDRVGDRFTVTHADLLDVPWWSSPTASVTAPVDAVVVSSTLHYLREQEVRRALGAVARHLRPGGFLANADRMAFGSASLDVVARAVATHGSTGRDAAGRATVMTDGRDDWSSWWVAARAMPWLADAFARRDAHPPSSAEVEGRPHTLELYVAALQAAGFVDIATIGQWFDDRVVVGFLSHR